MLEDDSLDEYDCVLESLDDVDFDLIPSLSQQPKVESPPRRQPLFLHSDSEDTDNEEPLGASQGSSATSSSGFTPSNSLCWPPPSSEPSLTQIKSEDDLLVLDETYGFEDDLADMGIEFVQCLDEVEEYLASQAAVVEPRSPNFSQLIGIKPEPSSQSLYHSPVPSRPSSEVRISPQPTQSNFSITTSTRCSAKRPNSGDTSSPPASKRPRKEEPSSPRIVTAKSDHATLRQLSLTHSLSAVLKTIPESEPATDDDSSSVEIVSEGENDDEVCSQSSEPRYSKVYRDTPPPPAFFSQTSTCGDSEPDDFFFPASQGPGGSQDFFSKLSKSKIKLEPSQPLPQQFRQLCQANRWRRNNKDQDLAWDDYRTALVTDFNSIYGTNINDIRSWRSLCRDLSIFPIPESLEECQRLVAQTHVNIVDLLDFHLTTKKPPRIFDTVEKLSLYTREKQKIFPREHIKAGAILQFLLRQIFNPSLEPEYRKKKF